MCATCVSLFPWHLSCGQRCTPPDDTDAEEQKRQSPSTAYGVRFKEFMSELGSPSAGPGAYALPASDPVTPSPPHSPPRSPLGGQQTGVHVHLPVCSGIGRWWGGGSAKVVLDNTCGQPLNSSKISGRREGPKHY